MANQPKGEWIHEEENNKADQYSADPGDAVGLAAHNGICGRERKY